MRDIARAYEAAEDAALARQEAADDRAELLRWLDFMNGMQRLLKAGEIALSDYVTDAVYNTTTPGSNVPTTHLGDLLVVLREQYDALPPEARQAFRALLTWTADDLADKAEEERANRILN